MAEQYAAMLRKAILRVAGAEARGEVYIKARVALLDQLKGTKAPPAEIAYQRVLLEEAIQAVELEEVDAAFKSIDRWSAKTPRELLGSLKPLGQGSLRNGFGNAVGVTPTIPPWKAI
jgi:hypothetical protein